MQSIFKGLFYLDCFLAYRKIQKDSKICHIVPVHTHALPAAPVINSPHQRGIHLL